LSYSTDIFGGMKPMRMGWARLMARMGEERKPCRGLMVIAEGELTLKN
jgi:hypothetical protein